MSTSSLTAPADFLSAAASVSVSLISQIFSMPFSAELGRDARRRGP